MPLLLLIVERIAAVTQQSQSNTQQGNKSAAGAQPREASVFALTDLLPDLIADNDEAIEALKSGRARGPCTGITSLDKALGGFFETGLHLLQASPGAGKTALALQIASDCQFPALYVTAEMPPLELLRRLIARQTKTFLVKLKVQLSSKNLEDLARLTISRLPQIVIVDATSGLASMDLIRSQGGIIVISRVAGKKTSCERLTCRSDQAASDGSLRDASRHKRRGPSE
jgi:replicative DNA helicase